MDSRPETLSRYVAAVQRDADDSQRCAAGMGDRHEAVMAWDSYVKSFDGIVFPPRFK
jgi:hypothetical protein